MSENQLTNAEFAVLGLVAENPRHGYEMEQVIEQRGMRGWTEIGFSSIYYVLDKLEKRGLLKAKKPEGAKARKVFSATKEGWSVLRLKTEQALAEPHPTYPSVLLGLASWPFLDEQTAIASLKKRSKRVASEIFELEKTLAGQRPVPDFVEAMFDFSQSQMRAEQKWIDRSLLKLGETTMDKTDFRKTLKHLYQPKAKEFVQVDVPSMKFVKVDGQGSPGAKECARAVETLYSISYPMKFMSKKELGRDYVVPPLEGLWWADDMDSFVNTDKDKWKWTMMIMVPDWVPESIFEAAKAKASKKLGDLPQSLRFEVYQEGLSVQIMHVGPYSEEGPTIHKMHHEYLPAQNLVENGHHHEIYLGDPRKTAPEKLKTVLRQPVRPT